MNSKSKAWLEATRPRTLPVSVAGVLAGSACATFARSFELTPALCCLLFALGAQIASNFANEYYDYKNGFDRKGREGFRRGVTEGDISPAAMKRATFLTLLLAAIPGLALIHWGGWWLLTAGILIAIFALAYSTGPYPLSHHGLGDIAVIIFFGIVPVMFTAWLQNHTTHILPQSTLLGLGVGLLAANVLIVNNYRDLEDDKRVGKHTTVVVFGRPAMSRVYLIFSITGLILLCAPAMIHPWAVLPLIMIPAALRNHRTLTAGAGAALNPLLKNTARLLLLATLLLILESIFSLLL